MNNIHPSRNSIKKYKSGNLSQLWRALSLYTKAFLRILRSTVGEIPPTPFHGGPFHKGGMNLSHEVNPPFSKGVRGIYSNSLSKFKPNLAYYFALIFLISTTACSYDRERQGSNRPPEKETTPIEVTSGEKKPAASYTTKVYLENSGSMDGYVQGNTQFEDAIYRMLVDLDYWADTLALHYINSRTIPYRQDVAQFISDLEPQEFQQRGGNRGNSDLNEVLQQVANQATLGQISVLISDFIFSVKGNNTEELLNNQKISLYNTFRQQLSQSPFSTLIIKLSSAFTGSYYDKNDRPLTLNRIARPYYIWLMGPSEAVQSLRQQIDFARLEGYQTSYLLSGGEGSPSPFYTVLSNTLNTGSFRADREYSGSDYVRGIENVEAGRRDGKQQFSLAVAVDLTSVVAEERYAANPKNYSVVGYQLDSIIGIKQLGRLHPRDEALVDGKVSHVMVLTSEQSNPPDLSISLLKQTPAWVVNTSATDDAQIRLSETQQSQTFGLQYLIEGVEEAYAQVFDNQDDYFTLTVSVKK
ncbi:MAG: hypothetical protein AAF632_10280 [Bacteroidota bacterium]